MKVIEILENDKRKKLVRALDELSLQFITGCEENYELTRAELYFKGSLVLVSPFSKNGNSNWKLFHQNLNDTRLPLPDFFSLTGKDGYNLIRLDEFHRRAVIFPSQEIYDEKKKKFVRDKEPLIRIEYKGMKGNRLVSP